MKRTIADVDDSKILRAWNAIAGDLAEAAAEEGETYISITDAADAVFSQLGLVYDTTTFPRIQAVLRRVGHGDHIRLL